MKADRIVLKSMQFSTNEKFFRLVLMTSHKGVAEASITLSKSNRGLQKPSGGRLRG